jgi:hypothetical protein
MKRIALLALWLAACASLPESASKPEQTLAGATEGRIDLAWRPPPTTETFMPSQPEGPEDAEADLVAPASTEQLSAIDGLHKIFAAPRWDAEVVGVFRAGQTVEVSGAVDGGGCPGGWRAVAPRGYVCVNERVTTNPAHPGAVAARFALPREAPLPFDYGTARGGPRFRRLPGEAASDEGNSPLLSFFGDREGPLRAEQGAYAGMKLAWSTRLSARGKSWLLTPDLLLVPAEEVDAAATPARRTRFDLAEHPLPFAVVIGPARRHAIDRDRAVAGDAIADGTVVPLVSEARWIGGRSLWPASDGSLVGGALAIFRARPRPRQAAADEKWVHASVLGGSLVAYEGDRPVFAALMSPGLGGTQPDHELRTPPGVFRVNAKWRTSDMGGPLPGGGSWRTREVPWVAYYDGSYAIHGAWWHDGFGRPRSHGCINLSPADAHWLFGWLEPALPADWYAVRADDRRPGTLVWISP